MPKIVCPSSHGSYSFRENNRAQLFSCDAKCDFTGIQGNPKTWQEYRAFWEAPRQLREKGDVSFSDATHGLTSEYRTWRRYIRDIAVHPSTPLWLAAISGLSLTAATLMLVWVTYLLVEVTRGLK